MVTNKDAWEEVKIVWYKWCFYPQENINNIKKELFL